MVYRNKNQVKKDADAYLAGGVSWYFHENGKFKIKEGETVSEGEWTADSKSKSLVCRIVTGEKERQLVFTDVYLTDTTFSAELKSFNITYVVDAVSAGNWGKNVDVIIFAAPGPVSIGIYEEKQFYTTDSDPRFGQFPAADPM